MTKSDFYILRNSITMRQVAEHYSFKIVKRGSSYFVLCPFHDDVNASMQIYANYRGFYCRGCGTGGDVTRFVQMYEGVSMKESAMMLSRWFGITISENGEIPLETIQRINKAQLQRERELLRQEEFKAELRRLGTYINMLEIITLDSEPFGDVWCYCQGKLPRLIGEWERKFSKLRKV